MWASIGQEEQKFGRKMVTFSYPFVLGAQKNHLIEMVLLSTYNICFNCEITKLVFNNTLFSRGLSTKESMHNMLSFP